MSKPYLPKTILLADDEPLHLGFLIDYLKGQGYEVELAETADSAIAASQAKEYRAYIVDLNIPASEMLKAQALNKEIEGSFPGISIARSILTSGISPSRVLMYSVHLTEALFAEVQRLRIQYVQKGRPKIIKEALREVLRVDPRASRSSSKS